MLNEPEGAAPAREPCGLARPLDRSDLPTSASAVGCAAWPDPAADVANPVAGIALAATLERMIEVRQLGAVPLVMVVQIAASELLLRAQQRPSVQR